MSVVTSRERPAFAHAADRNRALETSRENGVTCSTQVVGTDRNARGAGDF